VTQPAQWIDASGGTTENLSDDAEFNVTLPFNFPFYDVTTNQIRVGNNGAALVNATTGDVIYNNTTMGGAPNYFLAPFWDDLTSQTGSVYVQTVGDTPNRKVVVEWHNRPHYNGIGAASFEM
jgi:hypothetical protein